MGELSPLGIDRTAHSHSPSVPPEGTNLPTCPLGRVDRRNYKISTTTERGINELKITPQNDKEKEAIRRLGYANEPIFVENQTQANNWLNTLKEYEE